MAAICGRLAKGQHPFHFFSPPPVSSHVLPHCLPSLPTIRRALPSIQTQRIQPGRNLQNRVIHPFWFTDKETEAQRREEQVPRPLPPYRAPLLWLCLLLSDSDSLLLLCSEGGPVSWLPATCCSGLCLPAILIVGEAGVPL